MNARERRSVPRILPSASGWRAIPSTACAAAVPCPIPGPIAAKPTDRPEATTEAADTIGLDLFRSDSRFSDIDGTGYTVVIIDDGIDLTHPYFKDRIIGNYNYYADRKISNSDTASHGTHVAGIIGAKDSSYSGIAPGVNFIVFDVFPEEDGLPTSDNIYNKALQWTLNNAEKLPFKNNYFDYYTISFGIRNVSNIDKALSEAYRVLKPGGRFLCLEFSKVKNQTFDKLYKTYSKVLPQIGKLVVGKSEPYEYLINSIEDFYSQDEFFKKIQKQNFTNISYRNLSGGIVAIHSAWKV